MVDGDKKAVLVCLMRQWGGLDMGPGEGRRKRSKTMDVCVLSQSKANTDRSQTGRSKRMEDGGMGGMGMDGCDGKVSRGALVRCPVGRSPL